MTPFTAALLWNPIGRDMRTQANCEAVRLGLEYEHKKIANIKRSGSLSKTNYAPAEYSNHTYSKSRFRKIQLDN